MLRKPDWQKRSHRWTNIKGMLTSGSMSATPDEPVPRGESVEATRAVHLCLLLGRILFNFGATAERIQDSIACLARYLGFKVDALVSYEALLITVSEGETFRTRVDSRRGFAGLNLLGLLRVSQSLRGLLHSKPSPQEIEHTLCAIRDTPPRRGVRWQLLAAGCAGAAFCIVNGGDPVSWVCSFVAGAFIFAIRRPLAARNFNFHLTVFAIAIGGSFLAGLLARLTQTATPLVALLAPVLFLVPGVPMINGGIDIVRNHVNMGTARLGFTLAVIVALCLGVGLTLPILPFEISPPFSLPDPLGIALFSAAGALGAGALALLNNGSLPIIALCALGGLTGRLVRGLLTLGGLDLITASLIGVVCSTLLVSLIAERLGWPTVVASVMAALPMVPGYFAINGLHSLLSFATANFVDSGQLSDGLQALLRALFISVALVVGVIGPVTILQRDVERV
jgi:uncharacterized membrane protein YjjP (DUF1212 family)